MTQPDPRYPIGKFKRPEQLDEKGRQAAIAAIVDTPVQFRKAVGGLSEQQLDTPYREGGWTVRQLAHHLADSHMNAYVRTKLVLTEDHPTVKPYDEARWAELDDTRTVPVSTSLSLLDGVHERWAAVVRACSPSDWARTLNHPQNGTMRLDQLTALYAWHGTHHVAHVTALRERMGWKA